MNITLMILAGLALALTAFLVPALCARARKDETVFANLAEGTHEFSKTYLTDAAITVRHLLYKIGTDSAHIAVAGASDLVLGVVPDEATAAEEYVALEFLGHGSTKRMVASEAMATAGVKVYAAAGGKIALAGTVEVGVLIQTAGAADDVVEVCSMMPPASQASITAENVAATNVITASENGTTYYLNAAGGFTSTLPAAAAGLRFTFHVKVAPTTAYIILAATADTIIGYPIASTGGDESANGNAAGDQINFVANTALPGDRVVVESDGTSWFATCTCKATGAITITG